MRLQDVVVATVTWARHAAEADLLDRSLGALAASGLPTVVCDRGTNAAFLERLRRHDHLTVIVATQQGLVGQVQDSLARASELERRYVLYTEPDKLAFCSGGLQEFVTAAPDTDDVGAVLASRSQDSFDTFPRMQRYTETVVNDLCSDVIGVRADYCYGPFLARRELTSDVRQLPHHLGWGWRPALFRAAGRHGYRVAAITGEHVCPPDQRDEDEPERMHRIRQLSDNLLGLLYHPHAMA